MDHKCGKIPDVVKLFSLQKDKITKIYEVGCDSVKSDKKKIKFQLRTAKWLVH